MDMGRVMLASFQDELSKIAGELQGATRIGRKPIGIERMLEREAEQTELPEDFRAPSEKMAAVSAAAKAALLLGTGGAAALTGRQMNEDRKLGRMVRRQQQSQY